MSIQGFLTLFPLTAPHVGQIFLHMAAFFSLMPLIPCRPLKIFKGMCRPEVAYGLQVMCLSAAFLWLVRGHILSDFSFLNVALHSHSHSSLFFKIAGTWSNHEGSMLLWVTLLSWAGAWGAFEIKKISMRSQKNQCPLPPSWIRIFLLLYSVLNFLLISFLLFASDPFETSLTLASQGQGINPLLHNQLLMSHPPLLYAGSVGLSLPFAVVITHTLLSPSCPLPPVLIQFIRRSSLGSWVFLSLGLGLGSFWAYGQLGWGGWWFWDPVENIALVTWIFAGILVHHAHEESATILRLLSGTAFASHLIGVALVRSGVLTSVHSFALDPERGLLFGAATLGILLLTFRFFIPSAASVFREIKTFSLSRVTLLALPATMALIVGLIYPLLGLIRGRPLLLDPRYFSLTTLPLLIPLLYVIPLIPWQHSFAKGTIKDLLRGISHSPPWIPSLTLSGFVSVIFWYCELFPTLSSFIIGWGSLWGIFSFGMALVQFPLSWRRLGIFLSHGGIAVMALGMGLSTQHEKETIVLFQKEKLVHWQGISLTLKEIVDESEEGNLFLSKKAHILVKPSHRAQKTDLFPAKIYDPSGQFLRGDMAVFPFGLHHLCLTLGEEYDSGTWSLLLLYKPYIRLLWGGGMLAIGGMIILVCLAFLTRDRKKNVKKVSEVGGQRLWLRG